MASLCTAVCGNACARPALLSGAAVSDGGRCALQCVHAAAHTAFRGYATPAFSAADGDHLSSVSQSPPRLLRSPHSASPFHTAWPAPRSATTFPSTLTCPAVHSRRAATTTRQPALRRILTATVAQCPVQPPRDDKQQPHCPSTSDRARCADLRATKPTEPPASALGPAYTVAVLSWTGLPTPPASSWHSKRAAIVVQGDTSPPHSRSSRLSPLSSMSGEQTVAGSRVLDAALDERSANGEPQPAPLREMQPLDA